MELFYKDSEQFLAVNIFVENLHQSPSKLTFDPGIAHSKFSNWIYPDVLANDKS